MCRGRDRQRVQFREHLGSRYLGPAWRLSCNPQRLSRAVGTPRPACHGPAFPCSALQRETLRAPVGAEYRARTPGVEVGLPTAPGPGAAQRSAAAAVLLPVGQRGLALTAGCCAEESTRFAGGDPRASAARPSAREC